MGDELNQKQPSLFGQLSFGQLSIGCKLSEFGHLYSVSHSLFNNCPNPLKFGELFSGSYGPTFFGKNSSNPFSRSYFFGQLDLDQKNDLAFI